ncbi:MAG: alpha/beta fold hydrolase [Streptosporangiaceae bacterium]
MSEPDPGEPLTASLTGPAGAPVLVLGDSLGTSRAVWDGLVPWLGGRYRLLRFELPGHGGAPAPRGPYTIAQLGQSVLALLDQHGIERAAYAGISLGGMIGMWLAAHAPGRIGALGLVCTSAYLPPAGGWRARADQVLAHGMGSVREQSLARWFTPGFIGHEPAVAAASGADLERIDPAGYAGCCAAIGGMDLRGALSGIAAPALVIAGSEDPATPPDHGARIATGLPGARLLVVRGASHLATVSHPGQVSAALAAHLDAATGRSG